MQKLKRLSVRNCRGIVNGPDIRFGAGGVLLCGDNGTGKSSYIDALEKVLTGKCSSLDFGAQGISWRKQGCHILADCEPEIELEISDGNQIFTINLESSPSTCPNQLQPFLQSAHEGGFILRRRTLLDFIDAKPAERWKAVETILNVNDFREFEQKLNNLDKNLQTEIGIAAESIQDNEREIRDRIKIDPETSIDETSCIKNLNEKISSLQLTEISSLDEIEKILSILKLHIAAFKDMERWQNYIQFGDLLRKAPEYQDIIDAFLSYEKVSQDIENESKKMVGHFDEEVLRRGLQWIHEDDLENCPLCGNQIDLENIQKYVSRRLEEYSTIIQLKEVRASIHADFYKKIQNYVSFLDRVHEYIEKGCTSSYSIQFEDSREIIQEISNSHTVPQDIDQIQKDLTALQEQVNYTIIPRLQQEIKEICTSSPDIERYNNLYQLKLDLQTVPIHLKNIQYAQRIIKSYTDCQTQTSQLCKLAEKARKNSVQYLMAAISDTANELYQYIHPGESIGSPQIQVKEKTAAALELRSDFHGKTGDPRGHYSEGHVDSLGLCIFLAIRRFQYQQCSDVALLVLDDVLHSVDGIHRRSTANLIFEKFYDHQIFITTHDPLWFEYLKSASRKYMQGKKFEHYKISGWSLETGPIFGDHLNDYEWLTSDRCQKATPHDKTIKAGRLLEAMMQELCHNLVISVPFNKSGNYTLDPLWTSFYQKAKKYQSFKKEAGQCIDNIEEIRSLRNWAGAHFNEWASGITDKEAQDFCNAIIELRTLVYCEICSQFIKRINDLDGIWACKNMHLKYEKKTGDKSS